MLAPLPIGLSIGFCLPVHTVVALDDGQRNVAGIVNFVVPILTLLALNRIIGPTRVDGRNV